MSDQFAHLRDCRSCLHNTYQHIADCDFVSCAHPTTLAKEPRWQKGDPNMVSWRTADVHVREMHQLGACPTWEAQP